MPPTQNLTLYLYRTGEAEVLQGGLVKQTLNSGHYFGSQCLMGASMVRSSSVKSKTWMSLRYLKQSDLMKVIWKFPRLRKHVMSGSDGSESFRQLFVDESIDPVGFSIPFHCSGLTNT